MTRKTLGYVELEWICPNCNTKNAGTQRVCTGCGAAQPKDVAFEQDEHEELVSDQAKIEAAKAGADIHCAYCGARNSGRATICQQCGADLREGSKRVAGHVVGAFKTGPIAQIPCPSCGALNPENAYTCDKCGASLARPKTSSALQAQTAVEEAETRPFRIAPLVITLVIVGVILCTVIAVLTFLGGKSEAVTAIVSGVHWERSIAILGLAPQVHQAWLDEIPPGVQLGECAQRERSVQSEPAPNATEVCGTPYTVDTGSGIGEVVQDCEYHVYADYCDYMTEEMTVIDVVSLQGDGFSATWPNPTLEVGQQLGERRETYTINFVADEETYTYTTDDASLFTQFQIGSRWVLKVNAFGGVTSLEPAP